MLREDQIKKLEDLGYEVIGEMITKKDSEQTPLYIADLTKQGEIFPMYSNGNLEVLGFSIELKRICKERGWKYLKNKEMLSTASDFLKNLKKEISDIEKRLLED